MKIGLVGTGLMGQPMAMRLLWAKRSLVVYNRTRSKLAPLQAEGAQVADSCADLIAACDCIILMLADTPAIEENLLTNAARQHLTGRTVIQMGTIAPSESQGLHKAVESAGGEYFEAPVLGSVPQAKSGQLQVMVGASEEQFHKWSEILNHFGEPTRIGAVGTAAATKLALNQLIAALTNAFALSLSFVQRQGVDVEKFMRILRESALYAPTFDKKLQRILERNFADPNFPTKHLLKDTNLFIKEAQSQGLKVNSLAGTRSLLEIALEQGLADQDYSSLYKAIE